MLRRAARRLWLGVAVVVFALQIASASGANNPVPLVNQPLTPLTGAPGGSTSTVTVHGTGFVPGCVVNWNGASRPTQFVSSSELVATLSPGDLDRPSTVPITVFNPGPGGGTSNPAYFQIASPEPALGLNGPQISVGGEAFSIATGDLNGDGKADIVIGNSDSSSVSVLLGNGNGTFQPAVNYAIAQPEALFVLVADFNGDGKPDLAVAANGSLNEVSILLGNGDGTFQAHRDFSVISSPQITSLAAGDLNGDGILDLAIVGGSASVLAALGNGDGTFKTPVSYGVGSEPASVALGDFNGDDILDLAVTNLLNNTISILLGNGDGTFRPQTAFATAPQPGYLVTGDFNEDGKLDLATVARQQNDASWVVSVLLGNGDGTFQAHQDLATGDGPSQIVLGDFNNDTNLDLATVNACGDDPNCGFTSSGTISILLGNGDGTFQPHSDFAAGIGPGHFASADFNGDGDVDFAATSSGAVSVMLQTTLGLSSGALGYAAQDSGTTSPPQEVTLTNMGTTVLNLTSISLTGSDPGDYSLNSGCGATLGPGANCTLTITFTPTTNGTRTASVFILDSAYTTPQTIALTGIGLSPEVSLSPSSLRFGTQAVGTKSAPLTVSLNNTGNGPLNFSSIVASADFMQQNTCGSSLPAGFTCTVTVFFRPLKPGADTGAISLTDNAPGSPQTVSLGGTGTYFLLSPASVYFGSVPVGHTSAPANVTVTNVSKNQVNVATIGLSGTNARQFTQTNNCGTMLAGGASCAVSITFTPKARGLESATLTVKGTGSSNQVPLSGEGT
ncbi:MAG TPA: FG-GAP-like repeat-containing protein [Terriglobia bacterium]|nr:FG-GAP-like repeat-containing protein [Terriglobia bacterium]